MKKFISNSLIMAGVILVLLTADLLTKYFIFDQDARLNSYNAHINSKDYVVIGTRSLLHKTSTVFDMLNWHPELWVMGIIGILIFAMLLLAITSSDSKSFVIGASIISAGLLGNTVDNFFHGGVRDIFFTPWWDKGTFNLADVLMVAGLVLIGLTSLIRINKK